MYRPEYTEKGLKSLRHQAAIAGRQIQSVLILQSNHVSTSGVGMQLNAEERLKLTSVIISMLDEWGASDSEKIDMLAMPGGTRSRAIRAMREGVKPLPESAETDERIEHMLGIADALRTSNPLNESAGAMWMRRRNNRFQDRPPIRAMIEDGINGIMAVRVHLDCSWDWHTHSSKNF